MDDEAREVERQADRQEVIKDRKTSVSTAQQVATAYDLLVDAAGRLVRFGQQAAADAKILRVAARSLLFLCIFLFLLAVYLQVQIVTRDDRLVILDRDVKAATAAAKKAEEASIRAQEASVEAKRALSEAIATQTDGPSPELQEVFRKINEIHEATTGGR